MANLSQKPRQLLKNLVLGALFVGSCYRDFDIFEHVKNQSSVIGNLIFYEEELTITFESILVFTYLTAKSDCNSSQSEAVHRLLWISSMQTDGNSSSLKHQYPPNQILEMQSFDEHMTKIRELVR